MLLSFYPSAVSFKIWKHQPNSTHLLLFFLSRLLERDLLLDLFLDVESLDDLCEEDDFFSFSLLSFLFSLSVFSSSTGF